MKIPCKLTFTDIFLLDYKTHTLCNTVWIPRPTKAFIWACLGKYKLGRATVSFGRAGLGMKTFRARAALLEALLNTVVAITG